MKAQTNPVKKSVKKAPIKNPCILPALADVTKAKYTSGNNRFFLSAKDKVVLIEGDLDYVKGWGGQVVDLGTAVPAGTGGIVAGLTWPGYRWMKSVKRKNVYWNGIAWVPLPSGFMLQDSNNFAVGFYKSGAIFACQYGDNWPETFTDWNINSKKCKNKIKRWRQNINTTWSEKFRLRRHECVSSLKTCCSYSTKTRVAMNNAGNFSAGKLIVANGNIRSNDSLWFLGESRIAMAAHEFGHHLGNGDEYAGAASVDPNFNGDGASNGLDPNSIMGAKLSKVKKRHYRTICQFLGSQLQSQSGQTFTYKAVQGK